MQCCYNLRPIPLILFNKRHTNHFAAVMCSQTAPWLIPDNMYEVKYNWSQGKKENKHVTRQMSKSMMAANPPLRSLNNDVPSYVSFFNRSYRAVNLFWINYEGKLLRYARLPPLKGTAMNTYVTHPWIVRDAHTGYPLLMNGKPVFHPPTDTHEEARALIWIHIPGTNMLFGIWWAGTCKVLRALVPAGVHMSHREFKL